jgi:hypothetical protein
MTTRLYRMSLHHVGQPGTGEAVVLGYIARSSDKLERSPGMGPVSALCRRESVRSVERLSSATAGYLPFSSVFGRRCTGRRRQHFRRRRHSAPPTRARAGGPELMRPAPSLPQGLSATASCTWQRGVNLGLVVPHPATAATRSMASMQVRGRMSSASVSRSRSMVSWPSGHRRRM